MGKKIVRAPSAPTVSRPPGPENLALALAPWRPADYDAAMLPIPSPLRMPAVAAWWVLGVMSRLQYASPALMATYGETSTAIAEAASADPLFEGADGGYRTAALLIALAQHESGFRTNAVGDHGRSLGAWQIQPPTARVSANVLLLPRDAAPIAINLIRQSFRMCRARPVEERLAWYAQGRGTCVNEEPSSKALAASKAVFKQARWILLTIKPPGEAGQALASMKKVTGER